MTFFWKFSDHNRVNHIVRAFVAALSAVLFRRVLPGTHFLGYKALRNLRHFLYGALRLQIRVADFGIRPARIQDGNGLT